VVGGKYELVKLLGRGSMGEVWSARHRTLDELVAVKLLARAAPHGVLEELTQAAARFRFEAQLAARLSRKTRHIVRVTDHGEEGAIAYLVMELLEGQTLDNRLLRCPQLPAAEVVDLVAQIARALDVAHADGIVHRDLKPANVFLARDEDSRALVKLLDFGIARTMHTRRAPARFSTADGLVFGTPGYMSPEQARAARLDARCDLWALATVAYEALSGDLPIDGATTEEMFANLHAFRVVAVHDRAPELPAGLATFFARAFAPSISDRYASAGELAAAFARAVQEERAPATLPSARLELASTVLAAAPAAPPPPAPPAGHPSTRPQTLRVEFSRPSGRPSTPSRRSLLHMPLRPRDLAWLGLLVGAMAAFPMSRARAPRPAVFEVQPVAWAADARAESTSHSERAAAGREPATQSETAAPISLVGVPPTSTEPSDTRAQDDPDSAVLPERDLAPARLPAPPPLPSASPRSPPAVRVLPAPSSHGARERPSRDRSEVL
jgi:serine/threonine-protein kinase